jgi:hypothetical protein
MTPKEKAKELFDKFYLVKDECGLCRLNEFIAKQRALIAVDKIIQQWEVIDTYIADFGGKLNQSLKYWQEVKQEIQAL